MALADTARQKLIQAKRGSDFGVVERHDQTFLPKVPRTPRSACSSVAIHGNFRTSCFFHIKALSERERRPSGNTP
jgi:hypothetical protein